MPQIPTKKLRSCRRTGEVCDLVAERFLAVFFPLRFENTTVVTEVRGKLPLAWEDRAGGRGWRTYPDGVGRKEEPPVLPPVGRSPRLKLRSLCEGGVRPSLPRFSEARTPQGRTAGKLVETGGSRQAMKDSEARDAGHWGGDDRRELPQVGYLVRERKVLVPTEERTSLIRLLGNLASPELTASWEERLARMERRRVRPSHAQNAKGLATLARRGGCATRRGEGRRPVNATEKARCRRNSSRRPADQATSPSLRSAAPRSSESKSLPDARRKTGCKFAIWKTVSGKRISRQTASRKEAQASSKTSRAGRQILPPPC